LRREFEATRHAVATCRRRLPAGAPSVTIPGYEALKMGRLYAASNLHGWQNDVAVYIGGETLLGPACAAYGYAPNGRSNGFVYFGLP